MPAYLASDHRDRAINAMDAVRRSFERRRQTAERFALHAAQVNDKDTADFFAREAKLWGEAVDEVAVRIQVEAGAVNRTDIIELLQRLHDYMDNRADSDWEGTGNNVELAFVGEIDEAIKSLTTIRRDLGDINGQIHNWKLDVCAGLKPLLHSLQRGEQTVSGAIAKLEGRHV